MEVAGKGLHAQPEHTWKFVDLQAEEIFDLRAGDENRNAVGEPDHDGTGYELHRRAHAGRSHDHQEDASHHGAHEQAVNTVGSDDPGHHYYEGAGRTANLGLRSAKCRDQKTGDYCAVDAGLGRESRRDGEGHCQRQRNQTHSDAGNNIMQELGDIVIAKTEDGLGQPTVV